MCYSCQTLLPRKHYSHNSNRIILLNKSVENIGNKDGFVTVLTNQFFAKFSQGIILNLSGHCGIKRPNVPIYFFQDGSKYPPKRVHKNILYFSLKWNQNWDKCGGSDCRLLVSDSEICSSKEQWNLWITITAGQLGKFLNNCIRFFSVLKISVSSSACFCAS